MKEKQKPCLSQLINKQLDLRQTNCIQYDGIELQNVSEENKHR